MMSLFSSFDLMMFFYFIYLFTFFIFMNLIFLFFPISFMSKSLILMSSYLGIFFNSLSNSNFSKNFLFFVSTSFFFIFIINFNSIFPFNFAATSQPSVVLSISLMFWISLMLLTFKNNIFSQLSHFIPEGAPLILSPFLFVIELVSNIIRPLTLTVRLIANILAGHLLIILLSMLIYKLNYLFILLSFLNMVELLVSIIQSYIFVTLISLYYSEC